jgi:hypothetical protein
MALHAVVTILPTERNQWKEKIYPLIAYQLHLLWSDKCRGPLRAG